MRADYWIGPAGSALDGCGPVPPIGSRAGSWTLRRLLASRRGRAPDGVTGPDGSDVTAPVHHRPGALAAVFAGGLAGTPARYALSLALPSRPGHWPSGTFVTNLVGAFALGVLLQALARAGDDVGRRRLLRLGLGTGFLGAFTTYSALAVETDLLVRDGRPGLAAAYALASVTGGLLLAAAGLAAGARRA